MPTLTNISKAILLAVYCFFCWLMLKITLQYFPVNFDVAFLRIKQEYVALLHYKIAFYGHVVFSIFALLAGFTQFSSKIRSSYTHVHRTIGKVYIYTILFFAAPTGLVLGVYANGGWSSRLGFCLLAVGWFLFTGIAWKALKEKDYTKHQTFMIRSFALTLSAITLRIWKYLLVYLFAPRPMDVYQIVAWLGWVLNLAIAEILIFKYIKK